MHDIETKPNENKYFHETSFYILKRNKPAVLGLLIILILFLVALFASYIAPHDPVKTNLPHRLMSPGSEYPLGTDNLGRCIFSRLIYGARTTLQVGIVVVGISASLGVILGAVAGYHGGIIGEIIMRCVDVVLAFPGLILALAIAGLLSPSLFSIMLALALVGWTSYTRVVRGVILSVKEKDFVQAARSLGATDFRILYQHILPNVMAPVIVMASFNMAHVILAAAALSFLGLGAQPPDPEWGSMLNAGRPFMETAPHLTIFPGLAIMITVLAFNFVGDGLRDALDPH
ncbi:MAG: nickel transporter permease [Bacillota bacterium]